MVVLCNIPMGIKAEEIKKMCSEYGAVKYVCLRHVGSEWDSMRRALVEMEGKKGAKRVFDGLHEKKVRGCIITTRFPPMSIKKKKSTSTSIKKKEVDFNQKEEVDVDQKGKVD